MRFTDEYAAEKKNDEELIIQSSLVSCVCPIFFLNFYAPQKRFFNIAANDIKLASEFIVSKRKFYRQKKSGKIALQFFRFQHCLDIGGIMVNNAANTGKRKDFSHP